MSKRTGLGKGLGAFFGEDYEMTIAKPRTQTSEQGQSIAEKAIEYGAEHTKENQAEENSEENNSEINNSEINKSGVNNGGVNGIGHNLRNKEKALPGLKASGKTPIKVKEKLVEKTPDKTKEIIVEKVKIVEVEKEKFLSISLIEPNREQPRKIFEEEQLHELAESIKEYGVLQPLLVQKKGDYYEIIAGERRWRAAQIAGLREVPVVVREYSKQRTMEIALIENVQREDLNPIEEAKAYQQLIQEFGMKQEDVASRVAKNRATITNSLRLLKLDDRVQDMLIRGRISGGHARTLLSLEEKEKQYEIANRIIDKELSVRETEKLVKALATEPKKKKEPQTEERNMEVFYRDLEDKLKAVMGTKVIINKKDRNKGRIEIEYYSPVELERLTELLQSISG